MARAERGCQKGDLVAPTSPAEREYRFEVMDVQFGLMIIKCVFAPAGGERIGLSTFQATRPGDVEQAVEQGYAVLRRYWRQWQNEQAKS